MQPPAFTGDIVMQRVGTDGLRVLHADPRIQVSDTIVDHLRNNTPDPTVRGSVHGDLLRITADNGTWIYRLVTYDPITRRYLAEWVD